MLQECSAWRVAGIFFAEPTKAHYLLEISKKAGLAHTSVKQHLLVLKKEGIIKESVEERGVRKFPLYKADFDSREYKCYKRIYNVEQIKKSGLLNFLKDRLMPRTVILFGSYSKGEDVEDSDVDVFVECSKEELDLSRFEKVLNRRIQLHFKREFKEYPKELKNNIVNGMVLDGYLEAF